jgi:hypothetical protein
MIGNGEPVNVPSARLVVTNPGRSAACLIDIIEDGEFALAQRS